MEELLKIGKATLVEARIVVLTSSSNPGDRNKMRSYGVKQYIEKPITEGKLLPFVAPNP